MHRKTSVVAAVIAFATVGSVLFGGAALAGDKDDHKDDKKHVKVIHTGGGDGGDGGDVAQECDQDAKAVNFFFDSKKFDDVAQTATASNACTATSTGGAGGAGATD
jgi:hypothetical protein